MAKVTHYNFSEDELKLILIEHIKNTFHEPNVVVAFDISLNLNQSDNGLKAQVTAVATCLN